MQRFLTKANPEMIAPIAAASFLCNEVEQNLNAFV